MGTFNGQISKKLSCSGNFAVGFRTFGSELSSLSPKILAVVHRFQVLTSCLWTLLDRVSDGQINCKTVKKNPGGFAPLTPTGALPLDPLGAAPPDHRGAPSAALRATSLALYQTEPARFARNLAPPLL